MYSAGRISSRAFSRTCSVYAKAKNKPSMELIMDNGQTNIDRAFEHFDDLYGSVYGAKWPSMRLGLLCPQKFIAIPNTFADVEAVSARLEALGAFDLRNLWDRGKEKLERNVEPERNPEDEASRLEQLDRTLEGVAKTKMAEEIDTLYHNAPAGKVPGPMLEPMEENRMIRHVQEASTALVPPTKLKGTEDFEFESEYFAEYGQQAASPLSAFTFTTPTDAPIINFPYLRPYTFEGGNGSKFPPPQKDKNSDIREYICVNGASLAPVIALDLFPGVNVLDLCAGPGTKSLLALMTLCPESLTANDMEASRVGRIRHLMKEFTGNPVPQNVRLSKQNATTFIGSHAFDRVLADVPCSSDRIAATVDENSLFKPRRLKERLGLVKTQKAILQSGFSSLSTEPGSVCVYSTCTLSPIENDGAVAAALRETEEPNLVVDIEGLWRSLLPFQAMNLLFISKTKFGVLVEPNVFANSGPMFISRILRR